MSILDDDLDITQEQLIKIVVLRHIHNSDYIHASEVTLDNLIYDGHEYIYKFHDWYRMTIARMGFEGEGGYRVCWDSGMPARGWHTIVSKIDRHAINLEEFLKEIGEIEE